MVPIHLKRLSDSGKAEMPLSPDICREKPGGSEAPRSYRAAGGSGALRFGSGHYPPPLAGDAGGRRRGKPPFSPPWAYGAPEAHHQRHQLLLQPAGREGEKSARAAPPRPGRPKRAPRVPSQPPRHPRRPRSAHLLRTEPRAAPPPDSAALPGPRATAPGSSFCEAMEGAGRGSPGFGCGRVSPSEALPRRRPLREFECCKAPGAQPIGARLAFDLPNGGARA